METSKQINREEKIVSRPKERVYHDPFIKEFLAFCKLNELEERAAEILEQKIQENKQKGKTPRKIVNH